MQLVQSNDRANRLSFKGALAHKVEAALSAPEQDEQEVNQVLLLPTNFQSLSETDLHFTLMHNKELKHSRQSANLAVEIVFNKRLHPKTVTFQTIELKNPVQVPQFEKKATKRSAPRQLTAPDSTAVRMQAEKDKEAEFKSYIETLSTRTFNNEAVFNEPTPMLLRVPKNYNDFSEAELFHVLTHTTELEHSRATAYLAMDILSGKISKPENVTLQSVNLPKVVPTKIAPVKEKEVVPAFVLEAERDKRDQFKAKLASKASVVPTIEPSYAPESIELLLPAHYEELSEAGLFYTLTHNPELKHSHDSATLAVGIIFNKIPKSDSVKFATVDLTYKLDQAAQLIHEYNEGLRPDALEGFLPEREQAKYEAYLASQQQTKTSPVVSERELVLRVPANYKEISDAELLSTITNNLDYGHTHYTAYLTLDILSGRVKKPANVTLKAVKFAEKVVTAASIAGRKVETLPDIVVERERFKREAFKSYLAGKAARTAEIPTEVIASKIVLRVPSNYSELNETELLYVLMNNVELAHTRESAYNTIDFLSGAVAKPANVTLQAVKLEAPKTEPVVKLTPAKAPINTTAVHPLQKEAERPKRELYKQELADKANKALSSKPVIEEEKVLNTVLLPEGYEGMSPGELHFALVRNPELHHSQESARYALDVLSGKIKNAPVQFAVVILENPQLAPVMAAAPAKERAVKPATASKYVINRPSLLTKDQLPITNTPGDNRVLKIPHNYEELNETQLHFALSHNREYGHSYESTYETLDILYGRTECPEGTVFSTIEVAKPVERAY